jgi:hypothetical protein
MLATVALGLILSVPVQARAQYVFTTIDVPGASRTAAKGNSSHERVGEFDDAAVNAHVFVLNRGALPPSLGQIPVS